MSAYSQGSAPVPPPPAMSSGQFSNAYGLHKDAVNPNNFATGGVAPVNQMTNAFGGRQGGNPNQSMGQTFGGIGRAGGNRTSQHVATPGNNNVSYASPTLLASANTLWQKAANAPGSPGPANGMSLGFIKNTSARPTPGAVAPAPTPPPPAATPPAATPPAVSPNPIPPMPGSTGPAPISDGWDVMQSPFYGKKNARELADAAWKKNHMGAMYYSGGTRRTAEYAAYLRKHGLL